MLDDSKNSPDMQKPLSYLSTYKYLLKNFRLEKENSSKQAKESWLKVAELYKKCYNELNKQEKQQIENIALKLSDGFNNLKIQKRKNDSKEMLPQKYTKNE